MSRYSSDSDSPNYLRKSRHRRRSSSSSNSDPSRHRRLKSSKHLSSSGYKKSSKNHRNRNYGRSRSNSRLNSRHSRTSSKNRRRERSHSRKKCKPKSHHKSRLHSKGHNSKFLSRSSSSDSKSSSSSSLSSSSSSTSSPSSSSSSSSSSSTSSTSKTSSEDGIKKKQPLPLNCSLNPEEQLREKLLKAIKAAESADHQLKQQGVLPKGVKSRNDITNLSNVKPQSDVIKDINADGFVQKMFISSKHKKEENFDELHISKGIEESYVPNADANSIFHVGFFIDPKAKLDRWVRKLYLIRQRAISGEPLQ